MAITTFKIGAIKLNSYHLNNLAKDKGWDESLMGFKGDIENPEEWSEEEVFKHKQDFLRPLFKKHIEDFAKASIIKGSQAELLAKQEAQKEELKAVEAKVIENIEKSFSIKT